jgi:signal transduction histidine kinase
MLRSLRGRTFVGVDRARQSVWSAPPLATRRLIHLVLAGTLLCLTPLLLIPVLRLGASQDLGLLQIFRLLLLGGAGLFALFRWHLVRDSSAAYVGTAVLILGVSVPLRQPGPLLDMTFSPAAGAMVSAAVVTAVVMLIWRAQGNSTAKTKGMLIDTTPVAAAAGLLVVVSGVLLVWGSNPVVDYAVNLAMWTGLLTLTIVWYRRSGRATAQWLGAFACLKVVVAAVALASGQRSEVIVFAEGVALLAAAVCAFVGSEAEARWVLRAHDHTNRRVATDLTASLAARESDAARVEEQLHDVRSALATIRAADMTLRRHHDELDDHTRDTLETALTNELCRVEGLIRPASQSTATIDFRPAEVLAPLVAAERSHGADISFKVGDLVARGRAADLATVVQNLLVNARRYAPGSPIFVTGSLDGATVRLCVEDHGPGIPPEDRAEIFLRGWRGPTSAGTIGSGLGLFVSANLLAEMGGTIQLRDSAAGGACFVVDLPAGRSISGLAPDGANRGFDIGVAANRALWYPGLPSYSDATLVTTGGVRLSA